MKKPVLTLSLAMVAGAFTITSCGGEAETPATPATDTTAQVPVGPVFEEVCLQETSLSLSIADYYFGGEGEVFNFPSAEYQLASSHWNTPNDSTGTLTFQNYTDGEVEGGLKDGHAEIKIAFQTRNGNLLSPGTYKDGNFEPLAATTTITTNKGTTYFNWAEGMPETGTVTLHYVDDHSICGEINLSSDNKEVKYIGTVKLSGTFKI